MSYSIVPKTYMKPMEYMRRIYFQYPIQPARHKEITKIHKIRQWLLVIRFLVILELWDSDPSMNVSTKGCDIVVASHPACPALHMLNTLITLVTNFAAKIASRIISNLYISFHQWDLYHIFVVIYLCFVLIFKTLNYKFHWWDSLLIQTRFMSQLKWYIQLFFLMCIKDK